MRVFMLFVLLVGTLFSQDKYKLGVFPHLPLFKLHNVYSPVAKDLEKVLDKPLVLMTKPYYKLYKNELEAGVYDFAFIQPFDYVSVRETQGYIPLVRRKSNLQAILVVNRSASYNGINDIKTRIIASAPSSAAVSKLMKGHLRDLGFHLEDDFIISYSKNHFICLQKVLDSKAVACITAQNALNHFIKDKGVNNFKTILASEAVSHVLFVAHPRTSKEQRQRFINRVLSWDEKQDAPLNSDQFTKAYDKDYDRVRYLMENY